MVTSLCKQTVLLCQTLMDFFVTQMQFEYTTDIKFTLCVFNSVTDQGSVFESRTVWVSVCVKQSYSAVVSFAVMVS
jgi:hypothetical protein